MVVNAKVLNVSIQKEKRKQEKFLAAIDQYLQIKLHHPEIIYVMIQTKDLD